MWLDLSDATNANFALLAHALRLGWRWYHWNAFKRSGRHDSDVELCFGDFSCLDFEGLCSLMVSNPGVRAVAVGSVLSPACFQHDGHRVFSDRCIWGCGQLGTWDHIAWHCPDRPCCLPMPRYPVQARFGWVISGGDFNVT